MRRIAKLVSKWTESYGPIAGGEAQKLCTWRNGCDSALLARYAWARCRMPCGAAAQTLRIKRPIGSSFSLDLPASEKTELARRR